MLGCPFLDQLAHAHASGPGAHVVELEVTDDMRGPEGPSTWGWCRPLADCAGASVLARQARRPVVTSNLAIAFHSPGLIGPLRAVGVPLRAGRRLASASVAVHDRGIDDELVATALVSVRLLGAGSDQPAEGRTAEAGVSQGRALRRPL